MRAAGSRLHRFLASASLGDRDKPLNTSQLEAYVYCVSGGRIFETSSLAVLRYLPSSGALSR